MMKKSRIQTTRIQSKINECKDMVVEIQNSHYATQSAIESARLENNRYMAVAWEDHNTTLQVNRSRHAKFMAEVAALRARI